MFRATEPVVALSASACRPIIGPRTGPGGPVRKRNPLTSSPTRAPTQETSSARPNATSPRRMLGPHPPATNARHRTSRLSQMQAQNASCACACVETLTPHVAADKLGFLVTSGVPWRRTDAHPKKAVWNVGLRSSTSGMFPALDLAQSCLSPPRRRWRWRVPSASIRDVRAESRFVPKPVFI